MNQYFDELHQYIRDIEIIDTHEHLPKYEAQRDPTVDILHEYLGSYYAREMISVGMSESQLSAARDASKPATERFRKIAAYWDAARNTGYGRQLDLCARDLYGQPGIYPETIEALSASYVERHGEDTYRNILRERSKIKVSLLDDVLGNRRVDPLDCDREFFLPVFRIDRLIAPIDYTYLSEYESRTGIACTCLDDWLQICDVMIDRALEGKAVGFKLALAYERSLAFGRTNRRDAEDDFNLLMGHGRLHGWDPLIPFSERLQDYVFHYILRKLNQTGAVLQIHTGSLCSNSNDLRRSDPKHLIPLFTDYRNVRFVLFHGAYPFTLDAGTLVKMFPNVFLDMCWMHILSPEATDAALYEWLGTVPVTKINGFGGDCVMLDGVYGHQAIARENIAYTLSRAVARGRFDQDRARYIAGRLLYDNAAELYGI